jgi:hypothetical protein
MIRILLIDIKFKSVGSERRYKIKLFLFWNLPIASYSKKNTNSLKNLEFVSPCIIIYSNKSTNQMHQSLRFIVCRLNAAQHVSGILMPIIRSSTTAVAASGFTVGAWW